MPLARWFVCASLPWPTLTSAESVLHYYICHIPVYSWAPCNKCDAVSGEAPIHRRYAENASHAESQSCFNLSNFCRLNRNAAGMNGISTSFNVTRLLHFAFLLCFAYLGLCKCTWSLISHLMNSKFDINATSAKPSRSLHLFFTAWMWCNQLSANLQNVHSASHLLIKPVESVPPS